MAKNSHVPDQTNGIKPFKFREADVVKTPNGVGFVKERRVHPTVGSYRNIYDCHINGLGDLIYFEAELTAVVS